MFCSWSINRREILNSFSLVVIHYVSLFSGISCHNVAFLVNSVGKGLSCIAGGSTMYYFCMEFCPSEDNGQIFCESLSFTQQSLGAKSSPCQPHLPVVMSQHLLLLNWSLFLFLQLPAFVQPCEPFCTNITSFSLSLTISCIRRVAGLILKA